MLGRRPVGVDNADTRTRLKRGNEIVEQAVGLGDLVIHVHQNCNVEQIGWQPRIVRLTEADYNVLQSEVAHPTAQAPQIFGHDIFCYDAAVGTDDRGQPYDVIAVPAPMSATVIPDLMPSRRTSWRGSPAPSRSFSLCQIGLTMSATGRSGFGKAVAGVPDPAKNSCAETDIVNMAAKTMASVIRMTSPT